MPLDDVAPIFERINSTGTRLTIVDLMRAATWSIQYDLIEAIDGIRDDLQEKGFGDIDRRAILRNISTAAGGGFSADKIDALRHHLPDKLKRATEEAKEGYKRAIDFLSTQIKLPSDENIPYVNQAVVLTEIFRLIPNPSATQYAEIQNWFWKTGISGYFGGWNTGMMATDLAAVQDFASGKVNVLAAPQRPPSEKIWVQQQFRTNYAHAKILATLLAFHRPVDLLTKQYIDVDKALAWTNGREFHHFFPRAYLKSHGVTNQRIGSLANIIMLTSASNKRISDRAPSDYLREVAERAGDDLKRVLDSNLISTDAYEAGLVDEYDDFLELRAETIHRAALELTNWPKV